MQGLMPETCECYLRGEKVLADVIKLRISGGEIILKYLGGS